MASISEWPLSTFRKKPIIPPKRSKSASSTLESVWRRKAKADRLRRAYEELEWRIDELAAAEELDSTRPDLDGNEIMRILDVGPGPVIGKAYKFLLERRLDRGPVPPEVAEAELREWWATQT